MRRLQYRQYMLMLLTVVAVFSYLDRGVLALALESIKEEFQLSDSQLGFMGGFSFALFYAVVGLPIARWADRGNRNHVVTFTTGLWSLMLLACGLVGNFWQLLLFRVGVAVGESGCHPVGQSLIADYFARSERPKAMAFYWLCAPVASILSYIGGGWLIDQVGWRITFMAIGLPGILLAVLVKVTLREPRLQCQNQNQNQSQSPELAPSIMQTSKALWSGKSLRNIVICSCFTMFFSFGITIWIPAFFIRSYGMDASSVGLWYGLGYGVLALFSTYCGGYLASRFAPDNETLQMKAMACLLVVGTVLLCLCFIVHHKMASLVLMFLSTGALLPLSTGPIYAALQALVEKPMRAVALSIIYLLSNLIGMGLGPMVVGFVSDLLAPSLGQESLRYSMLLITPVLFLTAYHLWKAGVTVEEDIRAVEAKNKAQETIETSETHSLSDGFLSASQSS